MDKELQENGNTLYTGSILNFNYSIELADDGEFEAWIKTKLTKYKMNTLEKRIYKYLLDVDDIETGLQNLLTRIINLETEVTILKG